MSCRSNETIVFRRPRSATCMEPISKSRDAYSGVPELSFMKDGGGGNFFRGGLNCTGDIGNKTNRLRRCITLCITFARRSGSVANKIIYNLFRKIMSRKKYLN